MNREPKMDLDKRKRLQQVAGMGFVALSGLTPAMVWAGGSYATERTQILNWGILGSQLLHQVTLAKHSVDNIMAIPGQVMDMVTAPVADVMSSIGELQESLEGLKSNVTDLGSVWQRRSREMVLLGENPTEYFRKQKLLADTRGGFYKDQWDSDIKSAERLKARAEQVQKLSKEVPQVIGNLQALQLLNSQLSIVATGINDVLSVVRKQSVNELQDRMDEEEAKLIEADRNIKRQEALRLQQIRHKNMKSGMKMPWEY